MICERLPARLLVWTLAGLALSLEATARGDVRAVANRVEAEWKRAGATVARGEPRFLSEDETISIRLARSPEPCVTVALVGARGMSFYARVLDPASDDGDHGPRVPSVAGVLQVFRCGGEGLRQIVVTSEAGRGAVETLVAHSGAPLATIGSILPERTGGTLPPPPEPGGLPPLPSPDKRADVAEARALREGARLAERETWAAGSDGAGEGHVLLDAGCHRVELFAVDPHSAHAARNFRLDLDAELRAEESAALLARDRTDAPDARLEVCLGDPVRAAVLFAGSPPGGAVLVTHLTWPIPGKLPQTWGKETRARMAAAVLAHHLPSPPSEAVALAQGPSGLTPVPVAVEPGSCYIAVAALEHGHSRGLGLRAVVGAKSTYDDRGTNDNSGLVSFCARDRDHALLEVEARGVGVAWALTVFRLEGGEPR